MSHLNLVLAIEEHYGVKFATEDIPQLTDLPSIQRILDSKGRS